MIPRDGKEMSNETEGYWEDKKIIKYVKIRKKIN